MHVFNADPGEPAAPGRRSLIWWAVALLVAAAGLVVGLCVAMLPDTPQPEPKAGPPAHGPTPAASPITPAATSKRVLGPPPGPLVLACRLLRNASLKRGQRVVAFGPVKSLGTTAGTEHRFLGLPEGLGTASLSDDLDLDRPQVLCVFMGGRPSHLEVSNDCHIEGTWRGLTPIGRTPLLVECELVKIGK